MRKIKVASGLEISFSHAGAESEALTSVNITIPIDGDKYMQGVNIIDCIKDLMFPNIDVDAITQELTSTQLDNLGGLAVTGVIGSYPSTEINDLSVTASALNILLIRDNAALGIMDLEIGNTSLTYTP